MKLTKFTHACVRLDDGDRHLTIDPGTFSETERALDGVDSVLITHEHRDHVDVTAILAAVGQNRDLRIWCPDSVARLLSEVSDRVTEVQPGGFFQAGGFAVRTYGGQHALIHPSLPVVANVGYLVEGALYHPGDSLIVPEVAIDTLLVPTHAPWSKIGEILDFVIAVRAARAHQIHDGLLNEIGLGTVHGHVARVAKAYGTRFEALEPGADTDL